MASYGLEISGHRSHRVTVADLNGADLVLGMAREHVRHAVVTAPDTWPRAFTLKELVRRGDENGPAKPGEPLADWLARVHEGRKRAALLGDSANDDVADPMGGPAQAYADTAALLDDLMGRLVGCAGAYPRTACRGSGDASLPEFQPPVHSASASRRSPGSEFRSRQLSRCGGNCVTRAWRMSG